MVDLQPALQNMVKNKRKRVMRLANNGSIDESIYVALNRAVKQFTVWKRK